MSMPTTERSAVESLGYRIEAVIGKGGMGVVYRAFDMRLRRIVALKLMAPELALDERFRKRFARESELAMSLEHPNVVPIYDAGETDGHLYLAMRYVEGSDLKELLRREGVLEPARALAICRQVAQALDAAHDRGLVHRDVKPSNVLIDEREHVYLGDFGLTRRVSDQDVPLAGARSLGTPAYLAPEQIEGRPVDGRADVYSLGCLLYECATGNAPFSGGSRMAVIWAHLEEDPPAASECNPGLPAALDPVIQKAMAKEPADRQTTCSELMEAVAAASGLDGRKDRARRTSMLVVALVVLAALAAIFAARFTGDDGEAAGSALVVGANTLVRIDPTTNAVTEVIDVGRAPAATAVGGRSVWVYNLDDSTVSEIDSVADEVRHTTPVSTVPLGVAPLTGPMLAADDDGAWLAGYDIGSARSLLARIRSGGRGKREYVLGGQVQAVVVAGGAAWALVHRGERALVLRIDRRTGVATRQVRLPPDAGGRSSIDGLDVGDGAVWAMESHSAILHRVDLASGVVQSGDLGASATPPILGYGWIWVCAWITDDGSMLRVDPHTLRSSLSRNALPAEEGRFAVGHGSLWRHDLPSGTVMRFDARTGDPAGIIRVLPAGAAGKDLIVTSIAAGTDSVWAAVGRD